MPLQPAPLEELDEICKQDVKDRKRREDAKAEILYERAGFSKQGEEGDGY